MATHFWKEKPGVLLSLRSQNLDMTEWLSTVQFSIIAQSCPTHYGPMNYSTPGLPVHHQLPESIQIHVHRVDDAIQPSHPLSSPSPPAFNLSQHQGLLQWVRSSHQVDKYWGFIFNISLSNKNPGLTPFRRGLVGFPCSPRDSQESSSTPLFKSINSSVLSFLYSPTLTSIHITGKTIALTRWTFVGKVKSLLF